MSYLFAALDKQMKKIHLPSPLNLQPQLVLTQVQDSNNVGVHNGGQPVRNNKGCPCLSKGMERNLDLALCQGVQCACGLRECAMRVCHQQQTGCPGSGWDVQYDVQYTQHQSLNGPAHYQQLRMRTNAMTQL
eukprot:249167-Pelagomonas_calceolata.AAC.1